MLGQLTPEQRELSEVPGVPAPGTDDRPGAVAVARQYGDHDLADRQQGGLR